MYHFDDARRAVVVTDPHTPMPWINYLSNGRLHAFASQAGGGSAWWRSPQNYRLTRYRSWMAPVEGPGFYLYVQDEDGEVWSPSLLPCRSQLDERTSEHRPGFSSYTGRRDGMTVTQELFMAQSTDDLVWNLKLTNAGPKPRKLKLTAYVETGQLEYLQELQWGYYVRRCGHLFVPPPVAPGRDRDSAGVPGVDRAHGVVVWRPREVFRVLRHRTGSSFADLRRRNWGKGPVPPQCVQPGRRPLPGLAD